MNYTITSFPNLTLNERIDMVCNRVTYVAVRRYFNRLINLYVFEDTFYEVFMKLENDCIEKVEMLDDIKKLDLYIGYMVDLNEHEL